MTDALYKLTAHKISDLIRAKEVTCKEVTQSVLERIVSVDDKVKSYITVTGELALEKADAVDRKIALGEDVSPLAGIPWTIKDNMSTRGVLTTCSSFYLAAARRNDSSRT